MLLFIFAFHQKKLRRIFISLNNIHITLNEWIPLLFNIKYSLAHPCKCADTSIRANASMS